jgi:hypothetical protein
MISITSPIEIGTIEIGTIEIGTLELELVKGFVLCIMIQPK